MAIAAAFNPFTLTGHDNGHFWFTAFAGPLFIGVAASLLAALFFTKSQGGREIPRNLVRVAWVFLVLVLLGWWAGSGA